MTYWSLAVRNADETEIIAVYLSHWGQLGGDREDVTIFNWIFTGGCVGAGVALEGELSNAQARCC